MDRKCALVTGASRGIGRAIAIALAANGCDVGINYRNSEEKAAEVCGLVRENGAKAVAIQGDVGSVEDIGRIFAQFLGAFGRIDLLVNNAGITRVKPFLEVTEDMWDEVTNTDWKGAFFSAQKAARSMVESGNGGVIINVSSNQGEGCWPISSVYGPTKAAVTKFTRHIALELAEHGIRVNCIAPGYTTDPARNTKASGASNRIPLRRFAAYEEIAEAVVYLASDKAAYITGTCLTIDGGALLPSVPEFHFPE